MIAAPSVKKRTTVRLRGNVSRKRQARALAGLANSKSGPRPIMQPLFVYVACVLDSFPHLHVKNHFDAPHQNSGEQAAVSTGADHGTGVQKLGGDQPHAYKAEEKTERCSTGEGMTRNPQTSSCSNGPEIKNDARMNAEKRGPVVNLGHRKKSSSAVPTYRDNRSPRNRGKSQQVQNPSQHLKSKTEYNLRLGDVPLVTDMEFP